MGFPEGKNDWIKIMAFIIRLIEIIGKTFFGANPNGADKPGKK